MIKYHGTAQDLDGNAIPAASALIVNHLTALNATVYEDDEVTPKTNPLTTDSDGRFSFKSPAGIFDITVSKGSFSAELTEITIVEDPSLIYMINEDGGNLLAGDPVYVSGDGLVKKAQSDGTNEEANVIGVCVEPILTDGNTGRFRTIGLIDREGTPGNIGYLSSTGTITDTPPSTGFVTVLGKQVSADKFFLNIQYTIGLAT